MISPPFYVTVCCRCHVVVAVPGCRTFYLRYVVTVVSATRCCLPHFTVTRVVYVAILLRCSLRYTFYVTLPLLPLRVACCCRCCYVAFPVTRSFALPLRFTHDYRLPFAFAFDSFVCCARVVLPFALPDFTLRSH